jgi:hypothetical protein
VGQSKGREIAEDEGLIQISRRSKMPKIVAQIPDDIYRNINEEIKLGIFSDTSEAVVSAL